MFLKKKEPRFTQKKKKEKEYAPTVILNSRQMASNKINLDIFKPFSKNIREMKDNKIKNHFHDKRERSNPFKCVNVCVSTMRIYV